jgi:predicted RNA-binding protein YlqC (UPF0109 family)
MASNIDEQFIEYIVKSIVGNPDAVEIKRTIDEKGVLLELTVDIEDLGRVIGKRGATAQSLRTLLRALGTKNDARYNLKILDVGPPPSRRTDDDQRPAKDDDAGDEPVEEPKDEEPEATEAEETVETEDEPEEEPKKNESSSDLASRTRAELADLDDLDL